MLTRNRRRREQLNPNADINLINLVDLAFVLLIIFMITAPMLQGGIEIDLPQASTEPVTQEEGLTVSVDRSGKVFLGDVAVATDAEIQRLLPSYLRAKGTRAVYLRGDRNVNYGRVIELFAMMQDMGITEVSIVLNPEARRQ